MAEEQEILKETAHLPIAERAAHTNWRVRQAAYESVRDGCGKVFDSEDPVLQQYAGIFPKACADGNAAALDTALEALQALAGIASEGMLSRVAGSCCSNIVSKALGSRPSTAAKGVDCILALIEAEQAEKVMGPLIAGYTNKVPKVVVGALDATLISIRVFGARVVPINGVLDALTAQLESKDAKAREKAKEIMAEVAHWTGVDLVKVKAKFTSLREAIQKDLEDAFQRLPPQRPTAERFTRKEAVKQAAAAAAGGGGAAADGEAAPGAAAGGAAPAAAEEPEVPDSYEFAEPLDIVSQLPKDFEAALAVPKWSDRKAALTQLKELAAYPRLAPGDFFDVNRELKKIINKDSNIQVVAEAINCTANLAKGLRKEYSGPARTLCPVLLEKLKDKASVVTKACLEALGQMQHYCFNLADVAEDVAVALVHQNPKVKEHSLTWLTGCIDRETKAGLVKMGKADPGLKLLVNAAKCCEDASPAIRDLAQNFMAAAALKAGSLTALDKALSGVDDKTRRKLEEMVVAAARGQRAGAAAAPAGAAASRSGSQRSMAAGASQAAAPAAAPRAGARPGSSKPPAGPAAAHGKAAGAAGGAAAAGGAVDDEAGLSSGVLGKADAEAQFLELFGEAVVQGLQDPGWQVRRDSMDVLVAKAQEPEAGGLAPLLVQGLAHIPGWDDKNFQVMGKAFEVVRLASSSPSFTRKEALIAVQGAVDKLADLKLKGPACDMLLAVSEAVGPQCVAAWLHKRAAEHKNPKVLAEALNWTSSAMQEFGVASLPVAQLLDWVKADLGASTPAVRNACVQLVGVMHSFLGPQVGDLIRVDVKPALMSTIEAEFEKNPKVEGYQPPRTCRAPKPGKAGASGRAGGSGGGAAAAGGADEGPSMDDLLPRTDISSQVAGLVGGLTSSNWKERKAALDELEEVLSRAGHRIQPNVGDLMPALKQRMTDTNKMLTLQAVQLLGKLATAMGRPIAREDRGCLAAAIRCLTDPKPMVRQAVVEMLDAWVAVAPADAPLDELREVLKSPKCVGDTMQTAIGWMATAAAASKITGGSNLTTAITIGAMGAGYKTVPVRDVAAQLFSALVGVVGLQELSTIAHHLDKSASKVAIEAIAKAAGGAVPAAAAAAPSIRSSTSGGVRASTSAAPSARPSSHGPTASASSRPGTRPGTASVRASRATGVGASMVGLAGVGLLDDGPLLAVDGKKEERAKKAKYKGTKFEMRPDEVQQLESDLGPLASPALRVNLFAKDFKKHCLAADSLRAGLEATEQGEDVLPAALAALDLLMKWSVVRLSEGNTATLISVLSMLKVLFDRLYAEGHHMSEHEAKTFLPGLVEKCGLAQERLRVDCRELMRKFGAMYPGARMVLFIQEGLLSKNNRSRIQCAEEIGCLVDREGMRVITATKSDALHTLARLVSERDKDIRQAALGALEVVYGFEGSGIWKHLGKLTDQQTGIIEERLKTVDKDLARRGLGPGHRAAGAASSRAMDADAAGEGLGSRSGSQRATEGGGVGASALRHLQADAAGAAGMGPGSAAAAEQWRSSQGGPPIPAAAAAAGVARAGSGGGGVDPNELTSRLANLSHQQLGGAGGGAGPAGPSVSLQPLCNYGSREEVAQELEKCLMVLESGQMEDAIEVMKLLCYEMMDTAQRPAGAAVSGAVVQELLAARADRLVGVMAVRTHEIFSEASASIRANSGRLPNGRACKYCLNVLMSVFSSGALPRGLACGTAQDLMRALLLRLADDQLGRLQEGENLLKALNVLMLKILENSNRNHCFAALMELCLDRPEELAGTPESQTRWADLVVKCLIKITKALPGTIEALDLRGLLAAISTFFEALGVEEIRRRASRDDKPLRMVKTILHELCKLKGSDIYKYTGSIPQVNKDGTKAVIFPYIDLNIQTLQSNTSGRPYSAGGATPGAGLAATAAAATPGGVRASAAFADKELKQRVAVVLKHLAAKSPPVMLQQALSDLWQLMQQQGVAVDAIPNLLMDAEAHNLSSTLVAHLRHLEAQGGGSSSGVTVEDGAGAVATPTAGQLQAGSSSAGSRLASSGGGAGGPTLDDLKQRLNQLHHQQQIASKAPPAAAVPEPAAAEEVPGAASPAGGAGVVESPGGAGEAGGLIGTSGRASGGGVQQVSMMQSLRDRMKGLKP